MPNAPATVGGAPCWIDLSTAEPQRSEHFYRTLFGWNATRGDDEVYGGYVSFTLDGNRVAGMMKKDDTMPYPDAWTIYLRTDDAAATAEAIAEAGGSNMFEPMEVPAMGTMGFAVDATGASVGYWQSGDHTGFQVQGIHGAPVWFELLATDYEAAQDFYEAAFGWSLVTESDTDDFRYKVFDRDGEQYAGLWDAAGSLPAGEPATWSVSFGSDDVDATVARAVELGGSVEMQPEDTPYGRIATLRDVTGASFGVMSVE
ncbi:VOC family protein [Okibacterium endophyticum]